MEITKVREFISEKKTEKPQKLQFSNVLKTVLSFLGGFILMNPFVLGQFSPFAISLTASVSGICSATAAAGTIIGGLVFFSGTVTVKYIASALLCVLIKSLCARYFDGRPLYLSNFVNSFSSIFVISLAIMLATGFDGEEFMSILFESALCSSGTYIFLKASEIISESKDISQFTTKDNIVILTCTGIVLMHFDKYMILGFSPVMTIFAFVILMCAKLKNSSGGAIAGICLGAITGLGGILSFQCVGMALGGLVSGETARKNKYLSVGSFFLIIAVSAIIDSDTSAYMMIAEIIPSCIAMIFLPEKVFAHLSGRINVPTPVFIKSDNSRVLSKRLNDASTAITQISNCVDTVQKTLKPQAEAQLNKLLNNTWCNVCSQCDLRGNCRDDMKTPSYEAIERIAHALDDNIELDESRFPKDFAASCYCFDEIKNAINTRYLSYVAGLGAQGKVDQMQGLMSDQFRSMADILSDIACEFDENLNINPETTDICADEAHESGLNVISSHSYLDKFGRIFISLNVSRPRADFNVTKFTESLSNAIGTKLGIPELVEDGENSIFNFSQIISNCVEVGAVSRSADDIQVCGDYYQSFRDINDRHIIILSDGMGTGSRAAVDSAMAAELFSKLVKSGLSFDCALPIANSALLVKSDDESLATLDVVCIDLYTGRTDFMKAGAAATFIKHKDSVAALEQASLPIGILRDISFSKATAKLDSGDIILMVSDGVLSDCNGWIQQELKMWNSDDPKDLANFIVNSACERKLGKQRDDMTAIAIFIK